MKRDFGHLISRPVCTISPAGRSANNGDRFQTVLSGGNLEFHEVCWGSKASKGFFDKPWILSCRRIPAEETDLCRDEVWVFPNRELRRHWGRPPASRVCAHHVLV